MVTDEVFCALLAVDGARAAALTISIPPFVFSAYALTKLLTMLLVRARAKLVAINFRLLVAWKTPSKPELTVESESVITHIAVIDLAG